MSTAGPSKATGATTSHSRGDPTSRLPSFDALRLSFASRAQSSDRSFRSVDGKKARLAALWPEWNEADVNAESWDIGSGKKKETGGGKGRADAKSASSAVGTPADREEERADRSTISREPMDSKIPMAKSIFLRH